MLWYLLGTLGSPATLISALSRQSVSWIVQRWERAPDIWKKKNRGLRLWGGVCDRGGRSQRKKDGGGRRKLARNICCRSVPSPTGWGGPRIRCAAAAVATPACSNTNTIALLSQAKLWRWIWKYTGSPWCQQGLHRLDGRFTSCRCTYCTFPCYI